MVRFKSVRLFLSFRLNTSRLARILCPLSYLVISYIDLIAGKRFGIPYLNSFIYTAPKFNEVNLITDRWCLHVFSNVSAR